MIRKLLERPQQVSQLPGEALKAFTANLVVPVWQTIGRAIRGGADAEIHFVDAAWAPESAEGREDNHRTSVLVGMQRLLQESCQAHDSNDREVLQALYLSFSDALNTTENLFTSQSAQEAADASPDDADLADDEDWDGDDS